MDQLKNKKDYQTQIDKATTKEMLSIIQNKINSDLEKQNDINGESLREAISIFNEITNITNIFKTLYNCRNRGI
ncbi:hypothetical protein NW064_06550 [Mycoplasmopsis felis]|uniref:hypothetical protein n=1 Tax=Mycoplasmopsis felis TaxID=33923 RepID=UPI0021AE32A0|nr:hypothetical protein [Mycoplasmopsis felis]UWW00809.1 hypothetical protein NW064_06550 [Mycoplasmopsis felis]